MLTFGPRGIQEYAEGTAGKEPRLLAELSSYTLKHTDWPEMKISWYQASFMRTLLRLARVKYVLEVGTFTGYSALAMAEVLPVNGIVQTHDVDARNTSIARAFWKRSPHGKKIRLVLGDARRTLREVKGTFDAAFIDADKVSYPAYWKLVVPRIRSGGLIMADNTLSAGNVLAPSDPSARTMVGFNRMVMADRRVSGQIVSIRDGLTVVVRK